MSNIKYVDLEGLSHFKSKIDSNYVAKETGKGLSSNDYTNTEKTKLAGIDTGAEVNVIESVVVNGRTATVTGKTATVTIETGTIDSVSVNGTPQTITNKNVNINAVTSVNGVSVESNGSVVIEAQNIHYQTDPDTGDSITVDDSLQTIEQKLSTIEEDAQENVIESIKVNGTAQTVTNKAVDITVPTNNNQLTNGAGYQTASDVSTAISTAIAGVTQFDYTIVASLPATGVKGTIYLIANSGSGTNNYDEYIWINNSWEKLGSLAVDLSGYVKFTDLVAITNAEINALFA